MIKKPRIVRGIWKLEGVLEHQLELQSDIGYVDMSKDSPPEADSEDITPRSLIIRLKSLRVLCVKYLAHIDAIEPAWTILCVK